MKEPSKEVRELQELQKRIEAARTGVEIILKKRFAVPPDMNVEHCAGINIVSGHRIGFTQRQAYLERLGDLYAEGYLTQDEYDSRVEWINASQTVQQADIVFTDLKNALLGVTANPPKKPVKKTTSESTRMLFATVSFFTGMIFTCIPHAFWFGIGVLFFTFTYAIYRGIKTAPKRGK